MPTWYTPTGSGLTSTSTTVYATSNSTSTSASATTDWIDAGNVIREMPVREVMVTQGVIKEPTGHLEIFLKDGTHIVIDRDQNLRIRDDDAKITYKSNNTREFNRFINASDLLEDFIRDMGKIGARQGDILDTPIEIFINWIIFKAAQQDGDPAEKPRLAPQPKCKHCGKFIPRTGFDYCNPQHAEAHYLKLQSIAKSMVVCNTKNPILGER